MLNILTKLNIKFTIVHNFLNFHKRCVFTWYRNFKFNDFLKCIYVYQLFNQYSLLVNNKE